MTCTSGSPGMEPVFFFSQVITGTNLFHGFSVKHDILEPIIIIKKYVMSILLWF